MQKTDFTHFWRITLTIICEGNFAVLSLSDLPLQHVRQGIIYMYNLLYMYVCVLTWIYIYYSHVQLIYPWYEGEFECCANDLVASRRGYSDRCMQFSNAMGQISANYFQFNIPFHLGWDIVCTP